MNGQRIAVIVNPQSAHGRTGRLWPEIERGLRQHCGEFSVFRTKATEHAVTLTRVALQHGYERIISVGGDGTHYEVINGFFENGAPLNPNAVLSILPYGTGSDLAKTLGIPRDGPAFRTVLSEEIVQADVGRISLTRENGEPETAYFLNTCHVGIGGEVAVQVSHSSKVLGGFASFLFGTLRALAIYKDKRMRLNIDGVESEQIVKELIIAKGQYDGGGMYVAPHARLDNGLFDIYVIGEVSFPDAIMSLPKLYRGRLDLRPDIVTYYQARSISVNCDEKVYVSPHGELPGILPAHFDILPQSLRVVRRA